MSILHHLILIGFIFISFVSGSSGGGGDADELCDNSWCNNEGICSIVNNRKECRCLNNVYKGEKCDERINYCEPINPCLNQGKCM